MVRQIYCYVVMTLSLLDTAALPILIYYSEFNYKWIIITAFLFPFLLVLNIFTILFFGAPNNKSREYIFKWADSKEIKNGILKEIVCYEKEKGIWSLKYKGKDFIFDLKGWLGVKNRLRDIIFVQFHNHYINRNNIINYNYYKNYFRKEKVKIVYHSLSGKIKKKSFKPSFILKFKFVIASSHFPNQRYTGNEHSSRSLWDTYMIV